MENWGEIQVRSEEKALVLIKQILTIAISVFELKQL